MTVDGVATFSVISPVDGTCVSCKVESVVASGIQISVIVFGTALFSCAADDIAAILSFKMVMYYCGSASTWNSNFVVSFVLTKNSTFRLLFLAVLFHVFGKLDLSLEHFATHSACKLSSFAIAFCMPSQVFLELQNFVTQTAPISISMHL